MEQIALLIRNSANLRSGSIFVSLGETLAISKIANGESRNGERGTGNGERGTGNL